MINEVILTISLLVFMVTALYESGFVNQKVGCKEWWGKVKHLTLKDIAPYGITVIGVIVFMVLSRPINIVELCLYVALSITLMVHMIWLTHAMNNKRAYLLPCLGFTVIVASILYPGQLSANLFVFLMVVGLGPMISTFEFFSKKMFVYLSVLWLLYNICYVWVTNWSQFVATIASSTMVPISFAIGSTSIGLANLLYASLLISSIREVRYKIMAIGMLVGSNLVLTILVYQKLAPTIFPLLVLWVPCGLLVMYAERRAKTVAR